MIGELFYLFYNVFKKVIVFLIHLILFGCFLKEMEKLGIFDLPWYFLIPIIFVIPAIYIVLFELGKKLFLKNRNC